MWTIYRYNYKENNWYAIGTYNDLDEVKSILEHEIYLYNITCDSETPLPRFEVKSNFHKESD